MMNTSAPRTFSWLWNRISPSANTLRSDFPSFFPRWATIFSASGTFDEPEKTRNLFLSMFFSGVGGFEPPNIGSKGRRLTAWQHPNLLPVGLTVYGPGQENTGKDFFQAQNRFGGSEPVNGRSASAHLREKTTFIFHFPLDFSDFR